MSSPGRTPERVITRTVYSGGSPRHHDLLDGRTVTRVIESPSRGWTTPVTTSSPAKRVIHSPSFQSHSPHRVTTTYSSPSHGAQRVVKVVEHVIEGTEIAEQPAAVKKSAPPERKVRNAPVNGVVETPDLTPMGSGGNLVTRVVERTIDDDDNVVETIVTRDSGRRSQIFNLTHGSLGAVRTLHYDE